MSVEDHDPGRFDYEDARANDYEREVAQSQLGRLAAVRERLAKAAADAVDEIAKIDRWLLDAGPRVASASDVDWIADNFAASVAELWDELLSRDRREQIERDAR